MSLIFELLGYRLSPGYGVEDLLLLWQPLPRLVWLKRFEIGKIQLLAGLLRLVVL
jgi:hypothetical protein